MSVFNLKTATLALVTGLSLGGCAYDSYGPYGGVGVGVGYNSGYYDPYYSGRYYAGGYGGYGYPGYGYGYGSPYYGWYNGFYYPGTGYYVYDRHRHAHRWTDAQRRYWERQRGVASSNGGTARIVENWADFQNGPRSSNRVSRQQYVEQQRILRDQRASRQQQQTVQQRQQAQDSRQQERRSARSEAQGERRAYRGGGSRNRHTDND